jgi:large subunit ribosomal protein L23
MSKDEKAKAPKAEKSAKEKVVKEKAAKPAKAAAPKAEKAPKAAKGGKKDVKAYLYDIIRQPVVTEKSTMASEYGKVVFKVAPSASKSDVKEAVEALFGVKVTKVNTLNRAGKTKRFRGMPGRQNHYKKAVVTLAQGQTIDAMGGVK